MSKNPLITKQSLEVKARLRQLVDKYGKEEAEDKLAKASKKSKETARIDIGKAYSETLNYQTPNIKALHEACDELGIPKGE